MVVQIKTLRHTGSLLMNEKKYRQFTGPVDISISKKEPIRAGLWPTQGGMRLCKRHQFREPKDVFSEILTFSYVGE